LNYIDQARNLLSNLDQRMSPSIYDVAWLARLKDDGGGPRWPLLQEWLLSRQKEDGSWGSSIRHYHHDRVICTLVAAIALAENGEGQATSSAISRARHFLWQNTHLIYRDPASVELIAFELLFPTLMQEAQVRGLQVAQHTYGYNTIRVKKLGLIPPHLLYSPKVTTVHSLEFLGQAVSPKDLQKALFPNGSLGNSPSATAFYIHVSQANGDSDHRASEAYLQKAMAHVNPVLYLYPFRNFELIWALNCFFMLDDEFPFEKVLPAGIAERLQTQLNRDGIGLDEEFGIPDGDITSVTLHLLQRMGQEVDPAILTNFEVPDAALFRTYQFERNPSTGTNIHALEALRLMRNYPNREEKMQGIIAHLLGARQYNLYWTDKWHASPLYATSHALVALLRMGSKVADYCLDTIDWLANTQRSDGSWGFYDRGTAEETAYVLVALRQAARYKYIDPDVFKKGVDFLLETSELENPDVQYPELWIGKCLYSPYDIVKSAILAALIQC